MANFNRLVENNLVKPPESFRDKINLAYERLRLSGANQEQIDNDFDLIRYGMAKELGIEQSRILSVVELDGQLWLVCIKLKDSGSDQITVI